MTNAAEPLNKPDSISQQARRQISELLTYDGGRITLVRSLFNRHPEPDFAPRTLSTLPRDTITRTVTNIVKQLTASGMDTALDCFSPSLAWMVAQDLTCEIRLAPGRK